MEQKTNLYPDMNQGPPSGLTVPAYSHPPITTQPAATTIVVHQNISVGSNPQSMTCPNCRANITTVVKNEAVTKTHLFALGICLVGCSLGCCFIPYCVDSCQGQRHECPNCGQFIGMNK